MIEVTQLIRDYGATRALDGVSFRIEQGEIVGLLGPNGAGKSTTMRIICGALGATDGDVRVGGINVLEDPIPVKRDVGYLPEIPPVYPNMTVRAYLRYCGRLREVEAPAKAVERVIQQVGLNGVGHRLIHHLSKGYKQRVGLAQALIHEPKVLVLDEPVSGLDPGQRVEIRTLIRTLAGRETTVLLSTHVLQEVEAICDRVIILDEGRVVGEGGVAILAQQGHCVRLEVARPTVQLVDQLKGVEGVSDVSCLREGVYQVTGNRDVREDIAGIGTSYGLLAMKSDQALEEAYLRLTEAEE